MYINYEGRIDRRAVALAALAALTACSGDAPTHPTATPSAISAVVASPTTGYNATYLAADTAGFGALRIDKNLVNAWGIAIGPSGALWISSNGAGVSVVYDGNGNQLLAPVMIPARRAATGGAPTGAVFNSTTDFLIGARDEGHGDAGTDQGGEQDNSTRARFIFAGEDGIIAAWSGGPRAVRVATSASDKAVYKGIAIASTNGTNYLYVTNFRQSRIDVYDGRFKHVDGKPFQGKPFVDNGTPAIPSDYGPFGIANIGGKLYVTYAKHLAPDDEDDQAGPGNGYVSVFNPDGSFVMRFASNGTLNSPWAVTTSGGSFGQFSNAVIVGNFGDGRINAYSHAGTFLGQLQGADNKPLVIDGLWGAVFPDPSFTTALDATRLYFAAGPNEENHGAFGFVEVAK